MKLIINIFIVLFSITAFSQEQKVDYKKVDNDLVQATYYFADNSTIIEREGFFNKEGKLHNTWISYDLQGNKTVIANYNNGEKDGVWTYFKNDKINIVTYKENKIINVEEKALVVN
ncbi:membrane-binding protein [Lutibacter sp.]|uniref:membrane-binding protein n=1 Tax=Lutibacter sp. TaxID=1925666 RepID=UPI00356B2C1A